MRTLKQSPIVLFLCLLLTQAAFAQVCSSPATIACGMDDVGGIYPITLANATVGARINPAYGGNTPSSSNALGYNPGNGKFYYFKRNADQVPQEFVSFTPSTNTYAYLATCPSTNNIKTGAVSANGLGYYCIDDAANLYFYRFTSNQWKLVTSVYYDQWGSNVTATLAGHSSGDIAFDGWGDLWFLCSSTTQYGLYQFPATLPVASVPSLTIKQKIAPTTPTPNGASFAGIAISPTGQIYLSQYGDNRFYRLNNSLTLTLMGTFSTGGVGVDLTSCTMPFTVLASNNISIDLEGHTGPQVFINWTAENPTVKGYFIECSKDAQSWATLGFFENTNTQLSNPKYAYTYSVPMSGRYYYRIRQVGAEGQIDYSEIKFIDLNVDNVVWVTPNPTNGIIRIANDEKKFTTFSILNIAGQIIITSSLTKGTNTISMSELPNGTYLLRLQSQYREVYYQKIVKQ